VGALAALGVVLSSAVAIAAQGNPLWLDPEPTDAEPPQAQSLDEFFAEAPAHGVDPDQPPADSASEHSSEASQATAEVQEDEEEAEEQEAESNADNGDSGSSSGGSGMAAEVVSLTNAERQDAGCDPLRVDDRLTEAAQGHSEDMVSRDYFSHDTPDGVSPAERAQRAGYPSFSGENIAAGQRSAQEVVEAWMNSEGHRRNILNCDSKAIGVGLHDLHWTQKFGYE
jgi:uncharacterized protein YkwD